MAITQKSNPSSPATPHGDLFHVVDSTNKATTNFKYIFDVYINSSIVSRLKVFPDLSTGYGVINVAGIVRNYFASYFRPSASFLSYQGADNQLSYTVKFGEDLNGSSTLNLSEVTTTVFNYYDNVLMNNGYSYENKFITTRDKANVMTGYNENTFISYGATTPGETVTFTINRYNNDNVFNATQSFTIDVQKFNLLNVAPPAVNARVGSAFITESYPNYTISTSTDSISVNTRCSGMAPVVLHFLNQWGGYETAALRLASRQSVSIERKRYDSASGVVNSTGFTNVSSNGIYYNGAYQYATSATTTIKAMSDYLTSTDFDWMKQLILSPEVYMQSEASYFPVVLKSDTYDQKLNFLDKMKSIDVVIELPKQYAQFR